MKRFFIAFILSLLFICNSVGGFAEMNDKKCTDIKEVSVHDPSVIKDKDGKYYVFGSHITTAVSDDLIDWGYVARGYKKEGNVHFGTLSETLNESFNWAGEDDGDCVGGYAVWAPDVYYNENYIWDDRTKGAYMMYYSVSSTYKRSTIGLAVSKEIDGKYEYVDTVIYSGFTKNSSSDENSTHNNIYTNTNLKSLIEKGRVCGYKDEWGLDDYNNIKYPNAIDPCVYETKDGKLYLVYGSWSGGIFTLPLSKETGLPIYPGFDGETSDGRMIDRYFGTHIAGGNGLSGEGPYIFYDEESGFYYLQTTYDWLGTDGGYHIRMFRSENPTGPFFDMKGNSAVFGENQAEHGVKMFGNYYFNDLAVPYTSGGHCSTLIDDDGKRYILYHTRFKNSESFKLRVHEMFLNEDGWYVIAPYRYIGKTSIGADAENVCGLYEFINHGDLVGDGANVQTSMTVSLNEDGTVTGAQKGYWSLNGNYCTLILDNVTYKGVFLKQTNEKDEYVCAFSAVGENKAVWGVKISNDDVTPKPFMTISFENGIENIALVSCEKDENPKKTDIEPVFENGVTGQAVKIGEYGLELDGVDLNHDFTLSFWMKPEKISNYTPIVSASADFQDSGFDKWFSLTTFLEGKNGVIWSRNNETNQWFTAQKDDVYTLGKWQHITLVFDSNYYGSEKDALSVKLYVDGHNVMTGGATKGVFNSQGKIYIGINPWDELYQGLIDEIQLFDKALSHSEVNSLYTKLKG